jgi:hypothetical protein
MKVSFSTINQSVAVVPQRQRKNSLPNWQVAVIYTMIHIGLITVIVTVASGSSELGILSLKIHGAIVLLILAFGIPLKERL